MRDCPKGSRVHPELSGSRKTKRRGFLRGAFSSCGADAVLLAVETTLEVRVVRFRLRNRDRRARAVGAGERQCQRARGDPGFRIATVVANQTAKIAKAVAGEPQPVGPFPE